MLNVEAAGSVTDPHEHRYGWRQLAAYALGIGARRSDLAYLYEGAAGGMRVYPTYAVVPAYPAVIELLERVGAPADKLIHRSQRVVAHQPAPAEGTVHTTGRLAGVFDLKRFAELVIETRTSLAGTPLFDTEWTILVRDAGRFGGPRPQRQKRGTQPPEGQPPDWVVEQPTGPEQALLYRLSGDPNPLHVEDAVARAAGFPRGAILHGLCTYGFVARAVIEQEAAGDATRLRCLAVSFQQPVWPGDTIRTEGYRLAGGVVALRVTTDGGEDRPGRSEVLRDAWAEVAAVPA